MQSITMPTAFCWMPLNHLTLTIWKLSLDLLDFWERMYANPNGAASESIIIQGKIGWLMGYNNNIIMVAFTFPNLFCRICRFASTS